MTSMIFGAIYLTHQGIVHARHEKKRQKNYQRWEGLRDEYDEQRKISRESRSLDIQRTGQQPWEDNDRPILTLRDQQEAGDARTSWRPQESWNGQPGYQNPLPTGRQSMDAGPSPFDYDHRASITGSHARTSSQPGMGRSASVGNGFDATNNNATLQPQPTGYHGIGPMRATPTGANWDDGLPQRLSVQRRPYDDSASGTPLGRSSSLRTAGSANNSRSNLGSANSSANNLVLSNSTTHTSPPLANATMASKDSLADLNNPFSENSRFNRMQQQQQQQQYQQQQPTTPISPMTQQSFTPLQPQMTSNNPFEPNFYGDLKSNAQQNPGGRMATLVEGQTSERDMSEWWNTK